MPTSRAGRAEPTPVAPQPWHVQLLVDFANSVDHEEGTDDLTTPAGLADWLTRHGLLAKTRRATSSDLELARRLRQGLHRALVGNHDGPPDMAGLVTVAEQLPLVLAADDGRPGLRPALDGVPGALSQVLVAVNAAAADGTWRRVKICSADFCRWAYVDSTKNLSRSWCEWGCGNKIKTRNYRARRKADGRSPARSG